MCEVNIHVLEDEIYNGITHWQRSVVSGSALSCPFSIGAAFLLPRSENIKNFIGREYGGHN